MTTEQFPVGTIVQIGRGYQEWTVTAQHGDTLTLESNPSRAAVAGSSSRATQVATDRVRVLVTAYERRVGARARDFSIDVDHCDGCRDAIEWQLAYEDGDADTAPSDLHRLAR